MNAKTKVTLIIGGFIAFIAGWVIFVMSLLGSPQQNQSNILKNQTPKNITTQQNDPKSKTIQTTEKPKQDTTNPINFTENQKQTSQNKQTKKQNTQNTNSIKTNATNVTILAPKNLLSIQAWKIFQYKYKKDNGGKITYKFYDNEKKYNKDLIYKLATKNNSFDLAIVPAYWFDQIENVLPTDKQLKLNAPIQLSTIFDYTFQNFIKNNIIKAIPFAIDPIIGYETYKRNTGANINFQDWKSFILNSPDRLDNNGKVVKFPILLGFDKKYLNFIQKQDYSFFPVDEFIFHYYYTNQSKNGVETMKSFGNGITYKTFDFGLIQRYLIALRKYSFCKGYEKYCLLFNKKTDLVYGLASDYNFLIQHGLDIFKNFHFFSKKINIVNLPLASFEASYPAKGRIIIINPYSKNLSKLGNFLLTYIKLGKKGKLPFYKNMISPFLGQQKINPKFSFLQNYLGRFILLYNLKTNYPTILSKKEINYLLGNISIEMLFSK